MSSTWTLVGLGDRKYRLETHSGRVLGWIHGHAIRLLGLRDDGEALSWAPLLRNALDEALMRHYPGRYRPAVPNGKLRFVHDGAYEWIAAGHVPIARVYRSASGGADGGVALEFVLPAYANEPSAIDCANVLVTMLHERILSPSLRCETEETSHVGTAASTEHSAGQRERRRRERFDGQLSGK